MSFAEAQRDMRFAYFNGATGAVVSATAWLAAALVITFVNVSTGIVALLVGGMFIFPVSVVLDKVLRRPGKHSEGNPLGALALEGTIWMILTMAIAIGIALYRVEWFFPAMLLIIGGRYLSFATLFGMKLYWAFGATLAVSAVWLLKSGAPPISGAWTGALVEYVYSIALFAARSDER
ncbi:MAG: hypothetical protein KJO54_05405 [Gammaproteobacteria bacterium]|nr:hypothetical protein [Gammaproteobacteria bacterium]